MYFIGKLQEDSQKVVRIVTSEIIFFERLVRYGVFH